ncbi:hypothetical protein H696_03176 [Fonticula alba]|uniref:Uncharacterized protein n=1 Tax=Fonticula alba TaxID=691883 RepID=A0A058Z927_FONAL|nr:hypothetical protein H696_03176 [Fonticula alba]KCV70819.1 hypothetical protein H696_03176 [Fonticula alba]|eukprot:XP_009495335.1 hypothetical protein H696_03176 [Fonticula alba]
MLVGPGDLADLLHGLTVRSAIFTDTEDPLRLDRCPWGDSPGTSPGQLAPRPVRLFSRALLAAPGLSRGLLLALLVLQRSPAAWQRGLSCGLLAGLLGCESFHRAQSAPVMVGAMAPDQSPGDLALAVGAKFEHLVWPLLFERLRDRDVWVRAVAASWLGRLVRKLVTGGGTESGPEALLRRLVGPGGQSATLRDLGPGVRLLVQASGDTADRVRLQATTTLASFLDALLQQADRRAGGWLGASLRRAFAEPAPPAGDPAPGGLPPVEGTEGARSTGMRPCLASVVTRLADSCLQAEDIPSAAGAGRALHRLLTLMLVLPGGAAAPTGPEVLRELLCRDPLGGFCRECHIPACGRLLAGRLAGLSAARGLATRAAFGLAFPWPGATAAGRASADAGDPGAAIGWLLARLDPEQQQQLARGTGRREAEASAALLRCLAIGEAVLRADPGAPLPEALQAQLARAGSAPAGPDDPRRRRQQLLLAFQGDLARGLGSDLGARHMGRLVLLAAEERRQTGRTLAIPAALPPPGGWFLPGWTPVQVLEVVLGRGSLSREALGQARERLRLLAGLRPDDPAAEALPGSGPPRFLSASAAGYLHALLGVGFPQEALTEALAHGPSQARESLWRLAGGLLVMWPAVGLGRQADAPLLDAAVSWLARPAAGADALEAGLAVAAACLGEGAAEPERRLVLGLHAALAGLLGRGDAAGPWGVLSRRGLVHMYRCVRRSMPRAPGHRPDLAACSLLFALVDRVLEESDIVGLDALWAADPVAAAEFLCHPGLFGRTARVLLSCLATGPGDAERWSEGADLPGAGSALLRPADRLAGRVAAPAGPWASLAGRAEACLLALLALRRAAQVAVTAGEGTPPGVWLDCSAATDRIVGGPPAAGTMDTVRRHALQLGQLFVQYATALCQSPLAVGRGTMAPSMGPDAAMAARLTAFHLVRMRAAGELLRLLWSSGSGSDDSGPAPLAVLSRVALLAVAQPGDLAGGLLAHVATTGGGYYVALAAWPDGPGDPPDTGPIDGPDHGRPLRELRRCLVTRAVAHPAADRRLLALLPLALCEPVPVLLLPDAPGEDPLSGDIHPGPWPGLDLAAGMGLSCHPATGALCRLLGRRRLWARSRATVPLLPEFALQYTLVYLATCSVNLCASSLAPGPSARPGHLPGGDPACLSLTLCAEIGVSRYFLAQHSFLLGPLLLVLEGLCAEPAPGGSSTERLLEDLLAAGRTAGPIESVPLDQRSVSLLEGLLKDLSRRRVAPASGPMGTSSSAMSPGAPSTPGPGSVAAGPLTELDQRLLLLCRVGLLLLRSFRPDAGFNWRAGPQDALSLLTGGGGTGGGGTGDRGPGPPPGPSGSASGSGDGGGGGGPPAPAPGHAQLLDHELLPLVADGTDGAEDDGANVVRQADRLAALLLLYHGSAQRFRQGAMAASEPAANSPIQEPAPGGDGPPGTPLPARTNAWTPGQPMGLGALGSPPRGGLFSPFVQTVRLGHAAPGGPATPAAPTPARKRRQL